MIPVEFADRSVATFRQELGALLKRLDRAEEWFSSPEATIQITALAEEVERLCQQASACNEPLQIKPLIQKARNRLDDMQNLLGVY